MCNWRIAGVLSLAMTGGVQAETQGESVRPEVRPQVEVMRMATASLTYSLRPTARPKTISVKESPVQKDASSEDFRTWLHGFRARAVAQGIKPGVLDAAFDGVTYDADIIRRDRNQSEFSKTIWEYLDSAVSDARLRNGKSALKQHRVTLEAIEAQYGVEKEVVVAVWGLESAYGSYRGSTDIIGALATLAHDARRSAFFEEQLVAALKILQSGDTTARNMTGSWAGAMGHTQFMPTSYLDYAVDFTGDGKRDIWSDDPTDALASTAAYLAHFGWTKGQPWGVEVTVPEGFDFRLADRKIRKSAADWARLGVTGVNGAVSDHGPAAVLLPAGGEGAAFLIFDNFAVIERYNTADAYVIGVGHLSDRIAGGPPIKAQWPRNDRALTLSERKEMQERLTAKGFDTQGIDGRIGPLTIDAVRAYQVASGLTPDGYASMTLLNRLR
ncbi:lytic murein transglycosylase [Sedimentitalea todarodis]|uniref:Lytic murein transglycosylase n=1 Tax=Sedimentitalea todarodis TaxID=1631240 RepID=A0ABU3VDI0_9RHOB|nr:lytic murein transglycosylase [Sedimentitalea todarodis]MDU9004234.1 lytic murein transglycosylase [Sedimentitalea todarodis]